MKDRNYYILLPLILIFGAVYIWLAWPQNGGLGLAPRFDWPDETANYFWIRQFAQTGQLILEEPINQIAQNQIHPRSFNVTANGSLVPGSFLGLILVYGLLAKLFGLPIVFLVGPSLCALAVLAFYLLIKKFFDQKIALVSAILMLSNPTWWYYASSPLLPNGIFISTILISIAILICPKRLDYFNLVLAGLFFGLAFSIRPSEAIFLGLIFLMTIFFVRRELNWQKILLFVFTAGILFIPTLYFQSKLYGSFLNTGYTQLQNSSQATCQFCQTFQSLFLPFGFHPIVLLKNIWHHFILLFWWINLTALFGFLIYLFKQEKKNILFGQYLIFSTVTALWLFVFYGTWELADQMTTNLNTLAVSYVRYWLIIYLLVLPFVSIALLYFFKFFGKLYLFVNILFIISIVAFSGYFVLFSKNDSLIPVKNRIASYYQTANKVNQLTEKDAVIIVNRKDKVLFPERKVIHTFESLSESDDLIILLPDLIKAVPIYYFSLSSEENLILPNGLILEELAKIDNEYLYIIK